VAGVVIEDASDLHIALDHLHDRWFDLEAVVFDRARMEVTIPCGSVAGRAPSWKDWRSAWRRSTSTKDAGPATG
jgi:hypothetical protein